MVRVDFHAMTLFIGPAIWSWLRRHVGQRLARFITGSVLPEVIAVICILALVWGSIVIFLHHDAQSAQALALQSTSNLVRAFEESTRRTIGQIDQILRSARATYQFQGRDFSFDAWAR